MKRGDIFTVRSHSCELCGKPIFTSEIRTLKTFEHSHLVFRTVCEKCYPHKWWRPQSFGKRFIYGLRKELEQLFGRQKRDAFKRVENYL